jgi:hypothetical protein
MSLYVLFHIFLYPVVISFTSWNPVNFDIRSLKNINLIQKKGLEQGIKLVKNTAGDVE